ncbi:MAG: glycosyltransferase family 4 protein [Candidatus Eisenbacteria bacterium]
MNRLSIAAVLPHLRVFGGIRRYLSLGQVWTDWGHEVVLYTPDGESPDWLPFGGTVRPFRDLGDRPHDVALTPQPTLLGALARVPTTRRVWYCAAENEPGEALALEEPELLLAAVSTALAARLRRRAGRTVIDGSGAVDPTFFHPDRGVRDPARRIVTAYGRRSRPRKGTDLVVRAVRALRSRHPGLELVLFDHVGPGNEEDPRDGFAPGFPARYVINPSADELAALYAASDVFVAAEKRAGWCNTAAEAMASGACVVCTPSGTGDFARHGETALVVRLRHPFFLARALDRALSEPGLRDRLADAGRREIERYSWPALAAKLLDGLGLARGIPADPGSHLLEPAVAPA